MRRSGALVAGAFAAASALGLLLLALVARWLPPQEYAQFLVLWAVVFGVGAAMSAVEAESSRLTALAGVGGGRPSGEVGLVALAGGTLGAIAVGAVLALVPGMAAATGGSPWLVPLVVAAVVLFAPLCLARGVLLGSGRVASYASVVLVEALLRVLLVAALWLLLTTPTLLAAVAAVAVGGLAWVPVVRQVSREVDWGGRRRSPVGALRAVVALGAANALTALMLTAYPALVTAVVGTTAGLQTLFATVILTRVPLVAVTPLQAVAVPLATRALHSGQRGQLRRLWAQVTVGTVVLSALAFAAGWWLGPWAVRLFQGPGYDARPVLVAVLLAATCVLAVALLQVAVVVAAGKHLWVTATWVVSVAATATWLALGPGTPETRGMLALAVGTALAWAASSAGVLLVSRPGEGQRAERAS